MHAKLMGRLLPSFGRAELGVRWVVHVGWVRVRISLPPVEEFGGAHGGALHRKRSLGLHLDVTEEAEGGEGLRQQASERASEGGSGSQASPSRRSKSQCQPQERQRTPEECGWEATSNDRPTKPTDHFHHQMPCKKKHQSRRCNRQNSFFFACWDFSLSFLFPVVVFVVVGP